METRARYVQMGAFTLVVIAAGFAFVYWLNSAGGLAQRDTYKIVFDAPVSGLLRGSAVLFNGMRVGEVTQLALDAKNPKRVVATIGLERGTPVRADTAAGMDFQGLTGSPVIALVGGASNEPLVGKDGQPPTLVADPASSQSMSQAAREALRRFDVLLADNMQPMKSMIVNLEKFAVALGRNSDRLDGIVAGLERMTGGAAAKAKVAIYDLAVPQAPALAGKAQGVQLIVPDPSALSALDNERIQIAGAAGALSALPDVQWADALSKLVQVKMIRSFEDSAAFAGVSRPLEGFQSDFQLLLDIRKFQAVQGDGGRAGEVEIAAKIADGKGRIGATKVFRARQAISAADAAAAVSALDAAFASAAREIVAWTVDSVVELSTPPPSPQSPGSPKKGRG